MEYVNTILIADDEDCARDILEALLSRDGYRLEFARCGKEALEKAYAVSPSLALLDVMMPEMDGFEVCRRLRATPQLAEIPIILITAMDDRQSRLQGIQAGADDFLSKPFDREELRARVRTILRLNRYRRLHAERAKFEWVVQHAHEGYVVINNDNNILYANSYASMFLNLSENQAQFYSTDSEPGGTEDFLDLAKRQYLFEPQDAWTSWPNLSSTARYLVRPETSNSEAFWLQVDILEFPSEPEQQKVIHLYDVTAQMNARRNKWGFQTMLCHKLRTPLVGILGSLEFLANHVDKLSQAEIAEFAEMSLISTRRLHGEIEDILQYMSATGMVKIATPSLLSELPPLIQQISSNLQLQPVTFTMGESLQETWISLSRRAIELIFYEILENSVKFHPDQTPQVHIHAAQSASGDVTIQIRDNGVTLSPAQLSQMWTPYYQGEKYITGEKSGMGLGLAMVASLLWEIGGNCRAYNCEEHPGIVIELHLPVNATPPPPSSEGLL